ncbi:flagellar FliL protein [Meinhardsimonia xiamenensis]|uniref:Flagellar protein FliL n=1 Tax=Meinhardsimonia xiamenensis TaxID=990712 RepID=A0A1G9EB24_9RHOB|nr:flagellar basal body-associated FliL family protein [Meinhardsimonia xiamenensis]PRX33855.1 flagellar FliL protein [Meinhardsimonia xiamenensis]SDK73225.1 flagellar FliL protein [Meinhardsimonia xiamenensis]
MTGAPETEAAAEAERKRSKLPFLIGVVGFLLMGAGGFAASYLGLLPIGEGAGKAEHDGATRAHNGVEGATETSDSPLNNIAFVPVEPVVINLGRAGRNRHLKFRSELEVRAGSETEVAALMPRVVDVINGYLRAVEPSELEAPSALIRLRAQLLRRIQLVAGEERVRDLLIMEFVLN